MLDVADKDPFTPNLLHNLKQSLDSITDKELLVDSCVQASLPSSEDIQVLLEYGLQRLQNSNDDPDVDLLRTRIFGAVKRLGTFQIAVPAPFSVRTARNSHVKCISCTIPSFFHLAESGGKMKGRIVERHSLYVYVFLCKSLLLCCDES